MSFAATAPPCPAQALAAGKATAPDPVAIQAHQDRAAAAVLAAQAEEHPILHRLHMAIADAHRLIAQAIERRDASMEAGQRLRLRDLQRMLGAGLYQRAQRMKRQYRLDLERRLQALAVRKVSTPD